MTEHSISANAPSSLAQSLLRLIPKVDSCVNRLCKLTTARSAPESLVKDSVRITLDLLRQDILSGTILSAEQLAPDLIEQECLQALREILQPNFRPVINATGVIIHTNLGRSLLPDQSVAPLVQAATWYSNLEFDLRTGKRGSRYSLVEKLLCNLTGAESALVVNNNAAAVLIALETLAKGKEVIVSRGQLVEIGGSFRIPDVMARSGARLIEVGATNRTHLRDYENRINDETALILRVHCSNYRIIGFTKEVAIEDLVSLGRRHTIPVMEDLGSGCFIDLSRFGLPKEPTVQEVVASGVDVVTFSGDKLLGGPQAGIILGKRKIVDQIKKNPLNRALRIDKFTLAALESVLRLYCDEQEAVRAIPTLAMIAAPVTEIERKARRLMKRLRIPLSQQCVLEIRAVFSRVGGGAMPEQNLPSWALALRPLNRSVNSLEVALRSLDLPVIGRIENDCLLFDLRTVANGQITLLADAVLAVFQQ